MAGSSSAGRKMRRAAGSSFGHLSFDQYNQDQTLTLDSSYEDGKRSSGITINDAPNAPLTPEIFAGYNRIHSMPEGPGAGGGNDGVYEVVSEAVAAGLPGAH